MRTSELRDLARRYGIEPSYKDASGKRQTATKDALAAAIEKRAGAPLREVRDRPPLEPVIDPVIVAWGASPPSFELRVAPGTRVDWDVELEDGSWRAGQSIASGDPITLDAPLPHGYHTLYANGAKALIIAAPPKAAPLHGKRWGIFAPLYAAHTRRSWGAGDLGDLLAYTEMVGRYGGSVFATVPMLAAFDDEPSPYSPVSRLFWNEMYLDLERLPEFDPADVDDGAIAHLRQAHQVDHAGVRREKRRVLERCAEPFEGGEAFELFRQRANEYAEFRARVEERDSARYHLYVQFRLAEQMRQAANAARRSGGGLYLDFPLGVNPGGYDAWKYAHLFAKGVSVGAPPDAFFTKGQNWGFPPFDPDALRADRYAYFRESVRQHVSHAGILRIDHVMGLHRLYWIPEGSDARDGVYVRYPHDELYAILTLESRRHECALVGEDLGTVPPEVPKAMARRGLRRMYVVQYEVKEESPPLADPAPASVASINTHDMPTFAGFWGGDDIDDRVAQDLLDEVGARRERDTRERMRRLVTRFLADRGHLTSGVTEQRELVLDALLSYLAASDAEIVLLNLEDLWGETEPQNVPGVPDRSWKQKLRLSLEEAERDGSVRRALALVAERRARGLLRQKDRVSEPENQTKEG